jgi:hypothetical protein
VNARAMLRRRSLIAAASSVGAAWLSGHVPLLVASREPASLACDPAFLAWCSRLNQSQTLGKACLETLPAVETSIADLNRLIFDGICATRGDRWSASALAQTLRDRSRTDFREGRIVNVDGWMLSLTETRVYALAALLSDPHRTTG